MAKVYILIFTHNGRQQMHPLKGETPEARKAQAADIIVRAVTNGLCDWAGPEDDLGDARDVSIMELVGGTDLDATDPFFVAAYNAVEAEQQRAHAEHEERTAYNEYERLKARFELERTQMEQIADREKNVLFHSREAFIGGVGGPIFTLLEAEVGRDHALTLAKRLVEQLHKNSERQRDSVVKAAEWERAQKPQKPQRL